MGYTILTQVGEGEGKEEPGEYALAKPTNKTAYKFQKLRVKSASVSDKERARIAKREGFKKWMPGEEEEGNNLLAMAKGPDMKPPELSETDYVGKAAQVLFPTAPVSGNEDYIDRKVFREAENDFLSRIGWPLTSSGPSLKDLNSLIQIAQSFKQSGTTPLTSDTEKPTEKPAQST